MVNRRGVSPRDMTSRMVEMVTGIPASAGFTVKSKGRPVSLS